MDVAHYLNSCLDLAKKRKQGLKFRMGGGSDIGMVATKQDTFDVKPLTVEISGTPPGWDGADIKEFLTTQGWTNMEVLARRRLGRRQVKWIFRALPPRAEVLAGVAQPTWQYEDALNPQLQIFIAKAPPRVPKQFESVPVRPPKKSYRETTMNLEVLEIDNTQLDPPSQEDLKNDNDTDESDKAEKRERSRSPAKVRNSTKPNLVPHAEDEVALAMKHGWMETDLGGTGDCGWRSLAAAIAFQETGKDLEPEEARRKGASIRAKAVGHMRNNQWDYINFVAQDKGIPPEADSPDLSEAWGHYLDAMSQPDTWIDGLALKAASAKLAIPVVIWKLKDNVWLRTTLAPQFKNDLAMGKKGCKPVVLLLQDQHYTVLNPVGKNAELNESWLRSTAFVSPMDLKGAAKGIPSQISPPKQNEQSPPSPGTPSVHTIKSLFQKKKSGQSQNLSQCRKKRGDTLPSSPASTKTPSLHSIEPGRVGKGTINFCQSFSHPILPKSFSQYVPPDTEAPRGSKDPPPGPRASADCQSWAQALE